MVVWWCNLQLTQLLVVNTVSACSVINLITTVYASFYCDFSFATILCRKDNIPFTLLPSMDI